MASISFESVTKRFGDVVAVDDLTLDIPDLEFLVLLGPSGCGKSTALRMIAGLDEPSMGTVSIGGQVVNGVEPKDRDIAMVFQSYALYPHKSVRQNIEFPLLPRRVDKAERARLVGDAAAMLGLADLLDRKPRALSGGQRQRVALARAIVRRASVFLMDEPLSNLDAKLRTQTRAELIELHRRLETTFVYVTHDQIEAMTMASRVAILDAGVLQQVGAPQEVYDRPANLFVARFVGNPPMNTLRATITSVERDRARAAVAGGALEVGPHAGPPGRSLVLGVRPEHLHLRPPGDSEGIPASVRVVESLGHERLVLCRVDGADGDVVVRTTAEGSPALAGDRVRLLCTAADVHLFDPISTGRLDP
ncbi:MAG: ABC transporter ATP-binding protein [Microthrixaceae bacterium]